MTVRRCLRLAVSTCFTAVGVVLVLLVLMPLVMVIEFVMCLFHLFTCCRFLDVEASDEEKECEEDILAHLEESCPRISIAALGGSDSCAQCSICLGDLVEKPTEAPMEAPADVVVEVRAEVAAGQVETEEKSLAAEETPDGFAAQKHDEDGEEPELFLRQLHCGHIFHTACIDPWIMKGKPCAVCRQPFCGPTEIGKTDACVSSLDIVGPGIIGYVAAEVVEDGAVADDGAAADGAAPLEQAVWSQPSPPADPRGEVRRADADRPNIVAAARVDANMNDSDVVLDQAVFHHQF